jgi:hypothetical protein
MRFANTPRKITISFLKNSVQLLILDNLNLMRIRSQLKIQRSLIRRSLMKKSRRTLKWKHCQLKIKTWKNFRVSTIQTILRGVNILNNSSLTKTLTNEA